MGPTATGKTDLAFKIAEKYPVEIISVDSAMVYRGMNIGTAKPSDQELAKVPHHLIDILDPAEPYSVANFRADTLRLIEEIRGRGNHPVLVGGTMLYFKALFDGLAPLPSADPEIRASIVERASKQGWESIHQELALVDPKSAERIKPTDTQRLQRALEVYEITGTSMSRLWEEAAHDSLPYELCKIVIMPKDRAFLHEKIEQRLDLMFRKGFIHEVEQLYSRVDLHSGLPSIRCVGYRQVWDYLSGELEYSRMRECAVIATRQLAKRQMTWLRGMEDLHFFQLENANMQGHVFAFVSNKLRENNG